MKHRFGLVGFGSMGQNHARVLESATNVDFIGYFDINNNIDKHFKNYQSIEELVSESDSLIISTPTKFHHKYAMICLKENKNILIEKPYSSNIKEINELIDYSNNSQSIIKIGLLEKYNPVVQFLSNQNINDIISIKMERLSPKNQVNRNEENVLLDLSIHDFSILPKILNKNLNDYNFNFFFKRDDENNYVDILGQNDSTNLIITTSKLSHKKIRKIVVESKESTFIANLITNSLEIITHEDLEPLKSSNNIGIREVLSKSFPIIEYQEPLKLQLISFLETIENKQFKLNKEELIDDLNLHKFLINNI